MDHKPLSQLEIDRSRITTAQARGPIHEVLAYSRLSGPGWLQSAMTLGAGSLGSSLYLGILGGFSLLWIQPIAMLMGVVMLGALSYVTLSTGQPTFRAINAHINPALGWLWIVAVLLANVVWSLPQFAMCFAAIEQNLAPNLFLGDGLLSSDSHGSTPIGQYLVSAVVFAVCLSITWSYGKGSVGIRIYESILKVVVGLIVLSFMVVVLQMLFITGTGDVSELFMGFIPNPAQFFRPTASFDPLLKQVSSPWAREYWSQLIVGQQRDVMISAAASAVGINMTYMMSSLLLGRHWGRDFRRLAIFDLLTGMFIPYFLATSCVVIASAQQFHAKVPTGFEIEDGEIVIPDRFAGQYGNLLAGREAASRAQNEAINESPSLAEQRLAAVLVRRDAFDLAQSLEQLFAGASEEVSRSRRAAGLLFGVGVLGMTLSSISLMMLISGLVVCDVLEIDASGRTFRVACALGGFGMLWPMFWQGEARVWLTVVAGMFTSMLLPIAYVSFAMLMNTRSLMQSDMLSGRQRWICNSLMILCVIAVSVGCVVAVAKTAGWYGVIPATAVLLVLSLGHFWDHVSLYLPSSNANAASE